MPLSNHATYTFFPHAATCGLAEKLLGLLLILIGLLKSEPLVVLFANNISSSTTFPLACKVVLYHTTYTLFPAKDISGFDAIPLLLRLIVLPNVLPLFVLALNNTAPALTLFALPIHIT